MWMRVLIRLNVCVGGMLKGAGGGLDSVVDVFFWFYPKELSLLSLKQSRSPPYGLHPRTVCLCFLSVHISCFVCLLWSDLQRQTVTHVKTMPGMANVSCFYSDWFVWVLLRFPLLGCTVLDSSGFSLLFNCSSHSFHKLCITFPWIFQLILTGPPFGPSLFVVPPASAFWLPLAH